MAFNNQTLIEQLHTERNRILLDIDTLYGRLEAIENAIVGFGGALEKQSVGEYPKEGTYEEKIKYVLKRMLGSNKKEVTALEIAVYIEAMEEINDEEEAKTMHSTVTMIASSMYKAGKIKARKVGVKNLYYL